MHAIMQSKIALTVRCSDIPFGEKLQVHTNPELTLIPVPNECTAVDLDQQVGNESPAADVRRSCETLLSPSNYPTCPQYSAFPTPHHYVYPVQEKTLGRHSADPSTGPTSSKVASRLRLHTAHDLRWRSSSQRLLHRSGLETVALESLST